MWPVVVTDEPIRLHMERVARSSNRRHWLVQVGDALFLDEFPRCAGLSLLGIGGSRATFIAPGDSALVWKLTSVEDEPNRRAGHGPELLLGTYLPGIFASRTRLVGDGLLDIRSWGTIRVEILEMERLQPMPPEPSSSQIIHMAFVILAFSSAGIMTRDLNKHNWGVRRFSNDGVIQELVAIDGAD